MTSSGLSQLDALYANVMSQVVNPTSPDAETQKSTDGFQAAFEKASISTGAGMDVTKELEPAVTRSNESAKNHFEKNESGASRDKISGTETTDRKSVSGDNKVVKKSDNSDTADKIKEAVEDIKKAIAEATGMSEEDVEAAMETLGMMLQDLLNSDNIPHLVMELTGNTDSISLVTDEKLMDMVSKLSDMVKDVLANLEEATGLNTSDFADVLSQMTEIDPKDQITVENLNNNIPSDIVDGSDNSIPAEVQVSDTRTTEMDSQKLDDNDIKTVITKTDELMEGEGINPKQIVNSSDETATEDLTQSVETEEADPVSVVSEDKSASEKKGADNQSKEENHFSETNTFSQNLENRIENIINDMQADAQAEAKNVNAQDVIDQITDYMKLNIKSDATELDMKLNPESLGTLHIKVAAKEGVITAQFTAPNEEVKAILQSQISELTSKLEQNNVKIEAVEVTVESHAFEENLEQNQNKNDQAEEEKSKRKAVRRLEIRPGMTLDEIAELDEEDQLTAEMMALEGNSVDYTA